MGGPEKDEPSVITPDEFKSSGSSGKGIADKILEAKEKERVRVRAEQAKKESKRQKDNRGDKSKRCVIEFEHIEFEHFDLYQRCIADSSPRSPVESDSDSDSSSVLSSSSDDSRGSGRNLKRPARQARDSDNSDSDASRRSRSPARRRRRYSSGSASSGDGPRRTSPRRDARPRSESPSD